MKSKLKPFILEKEKQSVKLKGEVDPQDAFLMARRFATPEKLKLKQIKK